MPRLHTVRPFRPLRGALIALLLAGAALPCARPAVAQDTGGLRGALSDDGVRAKLLRPRQNGTVAAQAPTSPAAVIPAEAAPLDAISTGTTGPVPAPGSPPATTAAPPAGSSETAPANPRATTVDAAASEPLDPGAPREHPIEALPVRPDENPFEPQGIQIGTFILKPTFEQGLTATNNADSSANGSGAILSATSLRLDAVSDWGSGLAAIDAAGTYRKSISGDDVEDFEGSALGRLEFDIGNTYRASAIAGITIRPESAASPLAIPDAASQPLRTTLIGDIGLEKGIGKLRLAVGADVERSIYGDAELENGDVLSQDERNNTLVLAKLRAGYEVSAALVPFIEVGGGRRFYDDERDSAGYARSSDTIAVRAGLAIDLGEKFAGELSAGLLHERFDDPRLDSISAPSVAAELAWSPMRGTMIGLSAATVVEGATAADESGSILWSTRLSAERQMRANLVGNASAGLAWRDYVGLDGHDLVFNAEVGLTWWLNRYTGLTLRGRHETVRSSLPDRDAETDSVFLGLKLQR